jgi:formate/nitrite transporter FocA (FNT family)
MDRLLHSAKFWTAVLDALVSTLSIALAIWLSPENVDKVMLVVGLWQPVLLAVIAAWCIEDTAVIKSGGKPGK